MSLQSVTSWLERLDRLTPRGVQAGVEERTALATVAFGAAASADRSAAEVAQLTKDAAAEPSLRRSPAVDAPVVPARPTSDGRPTRPRRRR